MAFNPNEFSGALKGGGARNALFRVFINNPVNQSGDALVPFLCKAASLPSYTLGTIETHYQGRSIKIPGNRTFVEWVPTIINDENFSIRNGLEEWSNAINGLETNARGLGGVSPSLYKADAQVQQLGQDGSILREYTFVGMWPSEISTIDLAWETEGIEEFTVSFQHDYFFVSGGSTGLAGNG